MEQTPKKATPEEIEEEHVGIRTRVKRFFQRFELTSETPQNLLTAGLWQIMGTLIASIMAWLLVVIISRDDIGIGAGGVGIFNSAFAFFGLFSLLTVGLGKATSQIVSENISDKRVAFEHARNGTFITILTGIFIGIGLILGSFFIANPLIFQDTIMGRLSSTLFIIGIVMLVTGFRDGLISNLAAVGEYDEIAKGYMTFPLFQLLSGIIIIILIQVIGISVVLILIVYIFGIVTQTLILFRSFRRLWFNAQIFQFTKVDRRAFKILRQGVYFAITDIIPVGLLGSVTVIIILAFTGNYQVVGAYSIILGYSFGGLMVTGFVWPLITSVAEAYGQKNTERIKFYLNLIVKIFFYLTFLILAVILSLSRGIILLFHGDTYLTGSTDVWVPFMLVITGFSVAGFEYIICGVLLGVGKGRPAAVYLGSIFLITIGLSSLFLWLGIFSPQINAGLGFLIGTIIMLPILPYLIRKHIKQDIPWSIGLRSFAALGCTLLIGVLLVWPPWELIPLTNLFFFLLVAVLLGFIYGVLLIFFGAISQEDLDLIEKKAEEYGLTGIVGPLLSLFRKIMRISPFVKSTNEK
ncbi:MAG: hypothetical protein HWN66_00855 [Candidatus Helarchaeota archaeon]|nr:hypothetical protein [Candidatus Helarchaeota archaeon]